MFRMLKFIFSSKGEGEGANVNLECSESKNETSREDSKYLVGLFGLGKYFCIESSSLKENT